MDEVAMGAVHGHNGYAWFLHSCRCLAVVMASCDSPFVEQATYKISL